MFLNCFYLFKCKLYNRKTPTERHKKLFLKIVCVMKKTIPHKPTFSLLTQAL